MASPRVLSRSIGVAVIGGGFIGPVHAESLRRIGATVVGVLGSSPERAREFAASVGRVRVYRDLDELLSDRGVESVHVASPNSAHFEQVARILESGRHVICEKPLGIDSRQTDKLAELARARPSQAAAVNYNVRYYPLCREMKARVARGDIGEIFSVVGSYVQDWLLSPLDYNWRVEADGGANLRAAADIGTHWMDLAQYVLGRRIVSLSADLATHVPKRAKPAAGVSDTFRTPGATADVEWVDVRTEDECAVLFRAEGGIRGNFHVSQVTAGRKNRLTIEIAGSEGSLAWDGEAPNDLWIGKRAEPNRLLTRDPSLLSPESAAISNYPGGHAEGFADTFARLQAAVYSWTESDRSAPPDFPTFEDGRREVMLCEAIARSARERCWIETDCDE